MESLVAYLHYLAIVLLAGFLVAEMVVCRPPLQAEQVRLLPRLGFYLPNPFFIAKLALYVAVAVLSIKPTTSFLRWRRRLTESDTLPPPAEIATARRLIHVEVALLALMPLMAVLMARGIGR